MDEIKKITFEEWKGSDEDRYNKLLEDMRSAVKKKYTSDVLVSNNIYCESLMRIKLRKDNIIF